MARKITMNGHSHKSVTEGFWDAFCGVMMWVISDVKQLYTLTGRTPASCRFLLFAVLLQFQQLSINLFPAQIPFLLICHSSPSRGGFSVSIAYQKKREKGIIGKCLRLCGGCAIVILRHEVHISFGRVCVFALVKTQAQFSHTLLGDGNFV